MSLKFAAGITLYHPTINDIEKINTYAQLFDKVYIFNNTEEVHSEAFEYCWQNNVVYISNGENHGLSIAFNEMIIIASKEYVDYFCALDQDSVFPSSEILKMKLYIELHHNKSVNNIAIYAPFVDIGTNRDERVEGVIEKEWVITSGSFINMHVIAAYGIRYDENFFIDKFDIDLCKQIKNYGLRIVMCNDILLFHQLGESSGHKHPNHSVLRNYYIFRNRFYFNSKYFKGLKKIYLNTIQTIRHFFNILAYEDKKIKKILQLPAAISSSRKQRMGKKQ